MNFLIIVFVLLVTAVLTAIFPMSNMFIDEELIAQKKAKKYKDINGRTVDDW